MAKIYAFLADGLEPVELLTIVDLFRRASDSVVMVSINENLQVTASHDIKLMADVRISDVQSVSDADVLFLPGGLPGADNLYSNTKIREFLSQAVLYNRTRLAAICIAPVIFGKLGFLEDKIATCYPSGKNELNAKEYSTAKVVTDGLITTGRGMGCSIELGLELIKLLHGEKASIDLANEIQCD